MPERKAPRTWEPKSLEELRASVARSSPAPGPVEPEPVLGPEPSNVEAIANPTEARDLCHPDDARRRVDELVDLWRKGKLTDHGLHRAVARVRGEVDAWIRVYSWLLPLEGQYDGAGPGDECESDTRPTPKVIGRRGLPVLLDDTQVEQIAREMAAALDGTVQALRSHDGLFRNTQPTKRRRDAMVRIAAWRFDGWTWALCAHVINATRYFPRSDGRPWRAGSLRDWYFREVDGMNLQATGRDAPMPDDADVERPPHDLWQRPKGEAPPPPQWD